MIDIEIKRIYHASYMEIEFPVIRKHKFTKDFSWGFYCTKIQGQAEKCAKKFNTPIVNVYELTNIELLNIKTFEDYTDEWLEFIIGCRSGKTHDYDVVIGPIADDTIYDCIEDYINGQIDNQKLLKSMKSEPPVWQIGIHTIKALDCINFIESYEL